METARAIDGGMTQAYRDALQRREDAGAMDEAEFQTLYEATARPILRYLTGVTGRRDVAEDVLQETYCRFLGREVSESKTASKHTSMDANEMRRYLFRIATNLLRDRWRRGKETQWPEEFEESGETDVDLQMDVRRAMRMLKPRERELLWLAYVEGMNHAEIAAATGLNALSIRMLLYRARGKASELLKPGVSKSKGDRA